MALSLLHALLAVLTVFSGGLGLTALMRSKESVSLIGVIGSSVVLGMIFVSVTLFVLSLFFGGAVYVPILIVILLALGGLGMRHFFKNRPSFSKVDGWFLCFLLLQALVAGWLAVNIGLGNDGLFNFELRARLMFENAGQIPLTFFNDPSRSWAHLDYPLFVPMNEAWFYLIGGSLDQSGVKLLTMPMVTAVSCIYYSSVEKLAECRWRGFVASVMFMVVPGIFITPGGAVWMWGDFAMGLLFLAAAMKLFEIAKSPGSSVLVFSLYTGFLPWVKTEGIILAATLLLLHGVIAWRTNLRRRALFAAIPCLLVVGSWKVFCLMVKATSAQEYLSPSIQLFIQNHMKYLSVLFGILIELIEVSRWSLLWPLLLLALWHHVRSGRKQYVFMSILLIGIPMLCYTGVFFLNPRPYYLNALPRLLIPLAMVAIPVIAMALPVLFRTKLRLDSMPDKEEV